jgi:hypothetical protein
MRAGPRSVAEFRAYLAAKARRHNESRQEQEDARQHKRIRAVVCRRLAQERRVLQAAHMNLLVLADDDGVWGCIDRGAFKCDRCEWKD